MERRNFLKTLGVIPVVAVTTPKPQQKEPTATYLKQLLKHGVERNLVVFDSNTPNSQFDITSKLIFLMKEVGKNNNTILDTIYIPDDVFPENDWFYRSLDQPTYAYGCQIVITPHLNKDGVVNSMYKKLGCSFPAQHNGLIIGVDKTNKPLLGAITYRNF